MIRGKSAPECAWRSCDNRSGIEPAATERKIPHQHGAGFCFRFLLNDYIAGFFAVGGNIPFSLR